MRRYLYLWYMMIQRPVDVDGCNTICHVCWVHLYWDWYRQTIGECSLALPWMESRLQSLQLHSAGSWAAWAARPHARTLQLTPFPWFTVNTGSIIGVLVHQQYLNLWLNDIMRKYRLCRHVKYVCSCHLVYFCHYARYLELWWVYSLLS